jgi:hypothetical protein
MHAPAAWSAGLSALAVSFALATEAPARPAAAALPRTADVSAALHPQSVGRQPRLFVDAAGNATALWVDVTNDRSVLQTASRRAGGRWGKARSLGLDAAEGAEGGAPVAVMDRRGALTVVWAQAAGDGAALMAAHRAAGAGAAWEAPVAVSPTVAGVIAPALAVDDAGVVTAAWIARRAHDEAEDDVVQAAARAPQSGAWEPAQDVSAPAPLTTRPALRLQLAVDPAGRATLVWQQPTRAGVILRAASRPLGGVWEAPADLTAAFNGPPHGEYFSTPGMQLLVDARGTATVSWSQTPYAKRRTAAMVAARPAGGAWSAPSALVSGDDLEFDGLTADARGGLTALWTAADRRVMAAPLRAGRLGAAVSVSGRSDEDDDPWLAGVTADRRGRLVAVLGRLTEDGQRVTAATRAANGRWTRDGRVSGLAVPESEDDDIAPEPVVAATPGGAFVAVWMTLWHSRWTVQSSRLRGDGRWSAPAAVSAPIDARGALPRFRLSIATDAHGRTTALWLGRDRRGHVVVQSAEVPRAAARPARR